jgi:hypothetical protein
MKRGRGAAQQIVAAERLNFVCQKELCPDEQPALVLIRGVH